MRHKYLECGKIINTHGFRGAVKLESWCDSPQVLAQMRDIWLLEGEEYRKVSVQSASVLGKFVIAKLDGVDTEEKANSLRNLIIYAPRDSFRLPEGGYFLADILQLPVKDVDSGQILGTVDAVDTRGKTNYFQIKTQDGEALLPDIPQFVVRVDVDDAVYVRPIPGLLDGGAENI